MWSSYQMFYCYFCRKLLLLQWRLQEQTRPQSALTCWRTLLSSSRTDRSVHTAARDKTNCINDREEIGTPILYWCYFICVLQVEEMRDKAPVVSDKPLTPAEVLQVSTHCSLDLLNPQKPVWGLMLHRAS